MGVSQLRLAGKARLARQRLTLVLCRSVTMASRHIGAVAHQQVMGILPGNGDSIDRRLLWLRPTRA